MGKMKDKWIERANEQRGRPQFYECGGCGYWHPVDWRGDCRDDNARFTPGELDILYPDKNRDGWPDWVEADQPR